MEWILFLWKLKKKIPLARAAKQKQWQTIFFNKIRIYSKRQWRKVIFRVEMVEKKPFAKITKRYEVIIIIIVLAGILRNLQWMLAKRIHRIHFCKHWGTWKRACFAPYQRLRFHGNLKNFSFYFVVFFLSFVLFASFWCSILAAIKCIK